MEHLNPCEKLSESLKQVSGLQFLRLRGWRVSDAVVHLLVPTLVTNHQHLRHLDIGIEEDCPDLVSDDLSAAGLSMLTSLTFLRLPTQRYFSTGHLMPHLLATEAAAAFSTLKYVKGLDLSETGLGCSPEVVRALSSLCSLTALKLHRASIDEETFPILVSSLRSLQRLQSLNMWDYISRKPRSCAQLGSTLSMLSQLCSVTLIAAPQFQYGRARELVKALQHLPRLTMLELGNSVTRKEYKDFWHSDFRGRSWLRMKHWHC
jgi:hypothetical protein